MKIKFSRHAKRRARLYKISQSTIIDILTSMNLSQAKHEIIKDVTGFEHRLRIVIAIEADIITVITNYPLKKGRNK